MTDVHQGALLRPTLLCSKKKSIFIAAGTCANNVRSLKESNAWADLELFLFTHLAENFILILEVFKKEAKHV